MKSLSNPQDKAELLSRLQGVTPTSARQWGRMTPPQMVCHLGDSCRAVMGERAVKPAANPLGGSLVKWIALYAPMPWPHGIKTRPEVDQEIGGTRPAEFARDESDLERLIEKFARPEQDFASYAHPMFGRMSHAHGIAGPTSTSTTTSASSARRPCDDSITWRGVRRLQRRTR